MELVSHGSQGSVGKTIPCLVKRGLPEIQVWLREPHQRGKVFSCLLKAPPQTALQGTERDNGG